MIKTDITIAGGGVAGLLTALALARQNIEVVLLEKQKLEPVETVKPTGRTSALMTGSINFLKDIDIFDAVKDTSCPLDKLRIIDGETSTTFDAEEIGLPCYGYNVPNETLKNELIKKLKTFQNVQMLDDNGLWDFEERDDHMIVRLNDDREINTKLLIAADGHNSVVREIAGIKTIKAGYKQSAITCLINHSRAHENTSTEFHKPGGPFTIVPCPGNQSAIVWCEKTQDAEEIIKLKKSDFTQALQDMTQNLLGEITLETAPQSWPLKGMIARKITGHRLALIAEAAHSLHPIGAQGLNLSIRDIKALTDLIIRQKTLGLDLGALTMLKDYKAQRRNDIYTRFAGVSGFCNITSKKSKGIQRLRQGGLKLINNVPFLKRQAMRIGLGANVA